MVGSAFPKDPAMVFCSLCGRANGSVVQRQGPRTTEQEQTKRQLRPFSLSEELVEKVCVCGGVCVQCLDVLREQLSSIKHIVVAYVHPPPTRAYTYEHKHDNDPAVAPRIHSSSSG